MFGLTSKDADNLGAGLKICKKLKVLRIYNSRMDDDKFYSVYDGLKNLSGIGEKKLYFFASLTWWGKIQSPRIVLCQLNIQKCAFF